uniref:Cytochrome P450 6PW2 n=1 Tax=Maconellicoccus hirsutus TaxID=177089 RepID=A0AAT9UTR7_MACHI
MWQTVFQVLLLAPLIAYLSLQYYYNYWKRKNIPYVESHVFDFQWYKEPAVEFYAEIYRRLEGHKFGGFFSRFTPRIMIRDPDLIKHILIKDFDHFHDRGGVSFDKNEPITMHMFSAPGNLWKNLRTKLTPTFTSGKMKYMFSLVQECAEEICQVIDKRIKANSIIDVKDFSTRYTIEVISSCAFGLKAHTIQDGSSIFKLMALKIFSGRLFVRIMIITRSVIPWLKKIKFSILDKEVKSFFYDLVENTIEHRKTNSVIRNDFLQLLINMRDDAKQNFVMTNELLTAQCFLFFVAGFDTSSMAISGALYELSANAKIQKKLRDEIDEYLDKYENTVCYEMIKEMPYLNQVVSETLRKYPVLGALNRICVKRYRIPDTKVFIEKGTEVLIPIAGLHSDPHYFTDPDTFDPDRFKDPNSFPCRNAYLPFGDGPRNCIGSRFALMSVKLALVHLLRDFNFETCSSTRYPFRFERFKIVTTVKDEIFLKCSRK